MSLKMLCIDFDEIINQLTTQLTGPIISYMAADRDSVTIEHLQEMAPGESNGLVADDVTWPRKVKVVTPICLGPIILKKAGDRNSVTIEHL